MMHAPESRRFSPPGRLLVGLLGLGVLVLLVVSSCLTPDPRGFGTHEQLGLTPCSFYRWTGRLCPTCGATTAWAYLLDGQTAAAVRANLAATVLGGLMLAGAPWLLLSAGFDRWLVVEPTPRGLVVVGSAIALVAGLDWFGRVWL